MKYKKITPDIFLPETTTPEPIRLSELEAELAMLNSQTAQEPTQEELIVFARQMHPFYMNQFSPRKAELEQLINELKGL